MVLTSSNNRSGVYMQKSNGNVMLRVSFRLQSYSVLVLSLPQNGGGGLGIYPGGSCSSYS